MPFGMERYVINVLKMEIEETNFFLGGEVGLMGNIDLAYV